MLGLGGGGGVEESEDAGCLFIYYFMQVACVYDVFIYWFFDFFLHPFLLEVQQVWA